MEKTKEEILTPYAYTEQWGFIDVVSLANAKKAMQEYADQEKGKEALDFAEWMFSVTKEYQRGGTYAVTLPLDDSKTYTITELYQIYKKEQHRK